MSHLYSRIRPAGLKRFCLNPDGSPNCPTTDACNSRGICLADPQVPKDPAITLERAKYFCVICGKPKGQPPNCPGHYTMPEVTDTQLIAAVEEAAVKYRQTVPFLGTRIRYLANEGRWIDLDYPGAPGFASLREAMVTIWHRRETR